MADHALRDNAATQADIQRPIKTAAEIIDALLNSADRSKFNTRDTQDNQSNWKSQPSLEKLFGTPVIIGSEQRNSTEIQQRNQNLATGDVLHRQKDGDQLKMPNGETLKVNQNGPVLLDREGKVIPLLGSTRDLDGTNKWTHNASIEHANGSPDAQVKYKDGTEVTIKGGRIVSVSRGEITQTIKP